MTDEAPDRRGGRGAPPSPPADTTHFAASAVIAAGPGPLPALAATGEQLPPRPPVVAAVILRAVPFDRHHCRRAWLSAMATACLRSTTLGPCLEPACKPPPLNSCSTLRTFSCCAGVSFAMSA